MFRASVKIAYGFFTTSKNLNVNLTTTQVIDELQTLVKNNFNVEDDAVIEIVQNNFLPYAELEPELSDNTLTRENETFFYARIIRRFNNTEYLKTDIDNHGIQRACYLKKEDLDLRHHSRRYLVEADILSGSQQVEETQENSDSLCVICSENEVFRERRFECEHLFCSNCHSQWLISCSHYNCPLCRS